MEWLKNLLTKLLQPLIEELIKLNFEKTAENLKKTIEDVKVSVEDLGESVNEQVDSVSDNVNEELEKTLEKVENEIGLVNTEVRSAISGFTNQITNGLEAITEQTNNNLNELSKNLSTLAHKLVGESSQQLKKELLELSEQLNSTISNLNTELNETRLSVENLSSATQQEIGEVEEKLKLEITDLVNHIDSQIDNVNKKLLDSQKQFFTNLNAELKKLGNDKVVNGLLDVIKKLDVDEEFSASAVITPAVSTYDKALKFTLQYEGGYVNNKLDPGGETNYGVTKKVYDNCRKAKKLSLQSVKYITITEVKDIYRNYWIAALCDKFTSNLAIVMFDTAINFGAGRAKQFLQKALGVTVDGEIGPVTLGKLAKADHNLLAQRICEYRIEFRYNRVKQNPSQKVFLKGWLNRDNALKKLIGGTITIKTTNEYVAPVSSYHSREED